MSQRQLDRQVAPASCLSSRVQFSHAAEQTSVAKVFTDIHLREHCLEFLLHGIFMLCGVCKVFNAHIVWWLGSQYHELSKRSKKAVYTYLGCYGDVTTLKWAAHLHREMQDRDMLKGFGFVLTASLREKNVNVIVWCILNLQEFQVPINAAMHAYSSGLTVTGNQIVLKFPNTRELTAIRAIEADNLRLLEYCIDVMTEYNSIYLSDLHFGRFESTAIDCFKENILDFLNDAWNWYCKYSEDFQESDDDDSDDWMDSEGEDKFEGPILRGPCAR